MDNKSWKQFVEGMKPEHFNQYASGDGKELEENRGNPPKMASFASSSQMIYRYSCDIDGFAFEEQLPTTVGGTANLDGYLELADKHIFVEAKCHEPYGHSGKQSISINYGALYGELSKIPASHFGYRIIDADEKAKKMHVEFLCNGELVKQFDIKQMICHMLGIATRFLKHPDQKQITFLYFLYNPAVLQLSQKTKGEVLSIYDATCRAANIYNFKVMFGCIIDFLIEHKGLRADRDYVEHLKNSFEFILCDQNTYKNHLR